MCTSQYMVLQIQLMIYKFRVCERGTGIYLTVVKGLNERPGPMPRLLPHVPLLVVIQSFCLSVLSILTMTLRPFKFKAQISNMWSTAPLRRVCALHGGAGPP